MSYFEYCNYNDCGNYYIDMFYEDNIDFDKIKNYIKICENNFDCEDEHTCCRPEFFSSQLDENKGVCLQNYNCDSPGDKKNI